MKTDQNSKPVVVIVRKGGSRERYEYASLKIDGDFAVVELRYGGRHIFPSKDVEKIETFTLYRQDNPFHPEYGKFPDEVVY